MGRARESQGDFDESFRWEFAALATVALTTIPFSLNATYTDGNNYTHPTILQFMNVGFQHALTGIYS